ncbi:bifunctional 3-(3-hydroxy-phenyl)propionate/3-hydroxycinnamic acid hydroxylase [Dactylosporangium sp. AC04546]|uniref:bifunctional 3-(3-hydroxy-phenyl)propionate/3-hydroxycinnamic acid hydroxylase n=1 Tax=Dactylosporangium sp. AC04546 TaxID=2862460 RepID=UPI001EDD1C14|nr:bifunctional 3-(3-hydroxy-phenyl)propionate/3-hydroxycinnamic acid hydroxylase [Dactylosporangium sp. AC04546]WVK88792.1 bifunctional 3-(3-hydroxy-phenyl)propionate/3-hydroxycinnamic acid hydroxylase [Dactylosporangium sp. AC04546]
MHPDVVVVGCGPVGALTANLLGMRGVRTLVVERSTAPHQQPRAFSCDDEALRVYQQAGLRDEVAADMYAPPVVDYVDGGGRPFATIALDEIDFGLGSAPLHFFDQPRLEASLRAGFDRFPHVTLRTGVELSDLTQDGDGVTVVLRDVATGEATTVRARYVLGCDGARSTTRTAAGIQLAGASYEEPWLAVSGDVAPGGVRQPRTRFVCDWRRPAFVSPGAFGTHRLEFMLRDGETPEEMTRPETIARLLAPYVDPERFTVTRAVVYTFHHLVAERWRNGRVLLLGDAAHQMPPFLGQGLCSGLRDAANLTWKLALVLDGAAGPDLLDTYEAERRPHTEEMAVTSVRMGKVFLVRNRYAAAARDAVLRAVQLVPRVRRFVRHFEFKPAPALRTGLLSGGVRKGPVGTMFPQPQVTTAGTATPRPLDDVLGPAFTVIGPGVDARTAAGWAGPTATFVRVLPAGSSGPPSAPAHDVVNVVDVNGVLGEWFDRHGVDLAVLRPDRFVYSTTADAVPLRSGQPRPATV